MGGRVSPRPGRWVLLCGVFREASGILTSEATEAHPLSVLRNNLFIYKEPFCHWDLILHLSLGHPLQKPLPTKWQFEIGSLSSCALYCSNTMPQAGYSSKKIFIWLKSSADGRM